MAADDVFTITVQSLSGCDQFEFQIKNGTPVNNLRYAVIYQLLTTKNPAYSAVELRRWITRSAYASILGLFRDYERVVLVRTNETKRWVYDDRCENRSFLHLPQPGDRWFFIVETASYLTSELKDEAYNNYIYDSQRMCSITFLQNDLGLPLGTNISSNIDAQELMTSLGLSCDFYWTIFEDKI